MILGLHYDIRLCKYLCKEFAERHAGIVQYIFLSCNHRQPTLKSRQGQFDCSSNEFYKLHLPRPNHVDQHQEFLGLLLTRSSKQMLGS